MEKTSSSKIYFDPVGGYAYLPGAKAAITIGSSASMLEKPEADPKAVPGSKKKLVPWGDDNTLPIQIRDKIEKSELVSANLLFNLTVGYGDGIQYGKVIRDANGLKTLDPSFSDPNIDAFFEENDLNLYLLQQMQDMVYFGNAFAEIVMNREGEGIRKAVLLSSLQACWSRWEQAEKGIIRGHYYSSKWGESQTKDDIIYTPVLDARFPVRDAMVRTGKRPGMDGKSKDMKEARFVVPVSFPSPGRLYYSKPSWWSIFESGWYDFAIAIPEFKANLLKNQIALKYHIQMSDDYFDRIFENEGITDEKKRRERINKEFTDLNNFLSNPKNTGKSVITFFQNIGDGKEWHRLKITAIENPLRGGEYIEDSEEASNIICYAMGVHPSLVGAAPGKNKSINGTEARELFIIKQAMMKPFRDRLLRPLYVVKALNNWPKEVEFHIPDLMLTRLDANTGSVKKIS